MNKIIVAIAFSSGISAAFGDDVALFLAKHNEVCQDGVELSRSYDLAGQLLRAGRESLLEKGVNTENLQLIDRISVWLNLYRGSISESWGIVDGASGRFGLSEGVNLLSELVSHLALGRQDQRQGPLSEHRPTPRLLVHFLASELKEVESSPPFGIHEPR